MIVKGYDVNNQLGSFSGGGFNTIPQNRITLKITYTPFGQTPIVLETIGKDNNSEIFL